MFWDLNVTTLPRMGSDSGENQKDGWRIRTLNSEFIDISFGKEVIAF